MLERVAMQKKSLNFEDIQEAFASKSTSELKSAHWMFGMLNHPVLGPIGKIVLKWAVQAGLPIKPIIKATLYKHFVGGETLNSCLPIAEKLHKQGVYSILDYSEEGKANEAEFTKAYNELSANIRFSKDHDSISMTVFKMTAFTDSEILYKISEGINLNEIEAKSWAISTGRFKELIQMASESGKPVMVDAEESWIQHPIDQITLDMMKHYNQDKVVVINTFQMYRSDRLTTLREWLDEANKLGFMLGVKIVRGAYMEKERKRAQEKGYEDPIQPSKSSTDNDYNEAILLCLRNINKTYIVVATHNEDSTKLAAEYLANNNLELNHERVWFSQLLGMCDHISFTLSSRGYNVSKYVPYGPVKSVTPYLIRRADENSSVQGQAKKEMTLLSKEIKRRAKQ